MFISAKRTLLVVVWQSCCHADSRFVQKRGVTDCRRNIPHFFWVFKACTWSAANNLRSTQLRVLHSITILQSICSWFGKTDIMRLKLYNASRIISRSLEWKSYERKYIHDSRLLLHQLISAQRNGEKTDRWAQMTTYGQEQMDHVEEVWHRIWLIIKWRKWLTTDNHR